MTCSQVAILCTVVCCALAFKAAVYEHDVIFPPQRSRVLSRDSALQVMEKNLDVYKDQCAQAVKQKAQIIVFPEYGLYGLGWTRQTLVPYLEFIPDPHTVSWIPCDDPARYNNTEVQYQLSCMAKNSSIYLVVNFGARQPCSATVPNCPSDGYFQFSTNLVYDSQGKFVARYFKQNLNSDEIYFNRPAITNYTVFTTPFGRFATFSSYDIMFKDPAITLIKSMNITNIVYPVAWKNELPLLAAIEIHSAFSEGMHVNLMAANLHVLSKGYQGSGIYWPSGTSNNEIYYNNMKPGSGGKLLVQELSALDTVVETKTTRKAKKQSTRLKTGTGDAQTRGNEFKAMMNHDLFTFVPLRTGYGHYKVCQNTLCCETAYEGMFQNALYALGAFDGIHTYNGKYPLQACTFVPCVNGSISSCGQPSIKSIGYMDKMSFFGNFSSTRYVLPEVLVTLDNSTLDIVARTWLYQESIIIDVGVPGSPVSISMYAIGGP
ncbi:pantetheinase-like [Mizuhopecten yessoensis]|uniref:Pantetheinase n=1 Tax=Mizuhopecten yessoensis TaxID=6573 RepID=A0A210QZN0_MIZYE|nr:pantetheinase-like [Mizuhopecten yessoensis]OWF54210.1 Pantetheinase [Mizuhopecten yessoensis]